MSHPSIFGWGFGSGFPKATRIDTQIDAAAGVTFDAVPASGVGFMNPEGRDGYNVTKNRLIRTGDATPLAAAWEGHRYGLQAVKPAIEPIIIFQKPYRGKPLSCITETGAGALNIDAGRIEAPEGKTTGGCSGAIALFDGGIKERRAEDNSCGRWPANFVLDREAAERLDAQAGETGAFAPATGAKDSLISGIYSGRERPDNPAFHDDSGGPSRFYHIYDWNHEVEEGLFEADPVFYTGKATRGERDAGLHKFQMRSCPKMGAGLQSMVGHPSGGSGNTSSEDRQSRNPHPCVKPIALIHWLASLLLPPDLYAPRRLVVPFAGSGSEGIGSMLAGWEEIIMVENEAEYIPIIEARMKFWHARRHKSMKVSRPKEADPEQHSLFA